MVCPLFWIVNHDTIPSIYVKRVAELWEIWENLSEEVRADVVGSVRSAPRISRIPDEKPKKVCQFTLLTRSTIQQTPTHFKKFVYVEMPP